jgi:hypothetical protein
LFLKTKLNQWDAERIRCPRITSDTKKSKGSSIRVRKKKGRKKREKRKKNSTLNHLIGSFYRSSW